MEAKNKRGMNPNSKKGQFTKGYTPFNKGMKLSNESKEKISKSKKGKAFTEEHKRNVAKGNKNKNLGIKRSPETRAKMSLATRGRIPWNKGNISKNKRIHERLYRIWKIEVGKRDNLKCRLSSEECKGRLESHHIFPWRNYPELRYVVNNGITLCKFHHPRRYLEEIRMVPIFQELLSISKE